MHPDEHEQVALELETLIRDTQAAIDQVETYGLNNTMPEDYQALLDILDKEAARAYTGNVIGLIPI